MVGTSFQVGGTSFQSFHQPFYWIFVPGFLLLTCSSPYLHLVPSMMKKSLDLAVGVLAKIAWSLPAPLSYHDA
jgi:hypothetical protein